MTFRVGEMGKRVVVITSYDMSSNTSLFIEAVAPSGAVKEWTATLGSGVLTSVTAEDGSVVSAAASEWMYYDLAATSDLDEDGDWTLVGVYTNTGATPDDVFISDPSTLTVLPDNYT